MMVDILIVNLKQWILSIFWECFLISMSLVSIMIPTTSQKKSIRDILNLGNGSLIELNRLADEPVEVLVNGKVIAEGEVVVIDENFGVRINNIVSGADRIKSLR